MRLATKWRPSLVTFSFSPKARLLHSQPRTMVWLSTLVPERKVLHRVMESSNARFRRNIMSIIYRVTTQYKVTNSRKKMLRYHKNSQNSTFKMTTTSNDEFETTVRVGVRAKRHGDMESQTADK